ncbi:MAG: thiolase family protein [Candidatus Yanofskybacteria bacterium]|nr:thiolase family protein [Candidatus Yanofskybacteria bacterium]
MAAKRMVIVEGIRTAVGKFGGSLREVNAEHLLAYCFRHVVKKSGIDPAQIDEVIAGNIVQPVGNIARVAALLAKTPYSVPAMTVSRNCASGIEAISRACQAAAAGDGDIFLVGGTENMSQVPYIMKDARFGLKMMHHVLTDALWEGLFDPNIKQMMGRTAENVAQKWGITREEQDAFAVESHKKAFEAKARHVFDSQILPITVQDVWRIQGPNSEDKPFTRSSVIISKDESSEKLTLTSAAQAGALFLNEHISDPVTVAKYIDKKGNFIVERSVWNEGTVTVANACPMNDGAAALLIMTEEKAVSLGLTQLASIVSYAYVGCDPKLMGEGPIYAVPKALLKAGLKMSDIDIVELNEAFAAQSIACQRALDIPDEKLNVWGGAIALGHAVGATGSKLVVQAVHILKELQKRYAAITMCVGGGQGGCLIIERA